jgi:hypothetical protein
MPNHLHDRQSDLLRLVQAHAAPRCQHVKTNGLRCQSPALKRRKHCYYHDRQRQQPNDLLNLPDLEDANAIQVAIGRVLRATLAGQLEPKLAGLALYALQTAAANLRHTSFEPREEDLDHLVLDRDLTTVADLEDEEADAEEPAIPADAVTLRVPHPEPEAKGGSAMAPETDDWDDEGDLRDPEDYEAEIEQLKMEYVKAKIELMILSTAQQRATASAGDTGLLSPAGTTDTAVLTS